MKLILVSCYFVVCIHPLILTFRQTHYACFSILLDTPYAELWIGTHPSGPTRLPNGDTLEQTVGGQLPFLFKVLSAGKALSIQAHPCKDRAKDLHKNNPTNYVDDNHKPELAVALTPFEAMCGFRRLEEISILIKKHP